MENYGCYFYQIPVWWQLVQPIYFKVSRDSWGSVELPLTQKFYFHGTFWMNLEYLIKITLNITHTPYSLPYISLQQVHLTTYESECVQNCRMRSKQCRPDQMPHQTHNVAKTSLQRRCNVTTLQQRCCDVVRFLHYENMPIEIYWKFYHRKMKIFCLKNLIFSYFCSKHGLWVLVRTVSSRRF